MANNKLSYLFIFGLGLLLLLLEKTQTDKREVTVESMLTVLRSKMAWRVIIFNR